MAISPKVVPRPVFRDVVSGRLLSAIRPLDIPESDWATGIAFSQWRTVVTAHPLDAYSVAGVNTKRPANWECFPAPADHPISTFYPTLLAAVDGCDSFTTPEERNGWVTDAIRNPDTALARYAWTGYAGTTPTATPWVSPNPSLQGATAVAGGPHTPVKAIELLVRSMRETAGYDGQIWLHMPDRALPALASRNLIDESGSLVRLAGGHVVIADPGYSGSLNSGAVAAGATWVVATGPVYGAVGTTGAPEDYYPNKQIGAVGGAPCQLEEYSMSRRLGIVSWDAVANRSFRVLMSTDA